MNPNLSGALNVFRLLAKPSLCLPHATISTFNELPFPLEKAFAGIGKQGRIRAVVLDKDDCFAHPGSSVIHPPYVERFRQLRQEFPGHGLLVVSNTAGATSHDRDGNLASQLQTATGVSVLSHRVKKPGCEEEIMAYFDQHPDTGVTHPSQIAVLGDRLLTDMMLANMMGSYGVWVRDGVAPVKEKSVFAKLERRLAAFLTTRGYRAPDPSTQFE